MTAKEYLSQALHIEQRIANKMEQLQSLRSLAEKAVSTILPTPVSQSSTDYRMEEAIVRIVDMENELGESITGLLDLKRDIASQIERLDNPIQQSILEQRYLCNKSWGEISGKLGYERHYLIKLHNKSLEKMKLILNST